jgi:hypothetical protein
MIDLYSGVVINCLHTMRGVDFKNFILAENPMKIYVWFKTCGIVGSFH